MKSVFLSVSCLAALGAAAPAHAHAVVDVALPTFTPRPLFPKSHKEMDKIAPFIKPAVVVDAEPLIRPAARRQQVRFGPFNLPAHKPSNMTMGKLGKEQKISKGIMSGGSGITGLDPKPLLKGDVTMAIAEYLSSSLDPEGFNVMNQISAQSLCEECTVLSAKMDAVHENGTRADVSSGVYLHHVVAFNVAERKMPTNFVNQWLAFCPGGGAVQSIGEKLLGVTSKLFGGGTESAIFGFGSVDEFTQRFTTPDGTFDSGFYFAKKDRLLLAAEIVNYRTEAVPLYIQVDFEWQPGKPTKEAVTSLSSVTDCKDPMAFTPKTKVGTLMSIGTPVNKPGTVLSLRGHMHDGGESMSIWINGQLTCVSKADYSTGYGGDISVGKNWTTISKMSQCDGVWPVKKGDNVKLVAAFNEIEHPLRESDGMAQMEMGIVALTFVQD